MKLRDVLDENIICLELQATDKDDALHKMSHILLENGYIDNVEEFVKDIYLREKEGETGMGQGIAIPHGQSKSAKKLGVAIARLKDPIEWESFDEQPVDTIFLFCVSSDVNFARNHMLLLSKIAARLADDDLIVELKGTGSAEEFITVLTGE